MSSRRIKRIQNDLRMVKEDSERFKTVSLVSDDISHWEIMYNNNQLPDFLGSLKIYAKFPLEYPSKPPSIRIPQIYHPNVYATGALCLSILDEISLPGAEGASWRPTISMWSVLLGVQNVLIDPNPDSPANVPAKNMFVKYITSSILRKNLDFSILFRNKEEYEAKNFELMSSRCESYSRQIVLYFLYLFYLLDDSYSV